MIQLIYIYKLEYREKLSIIMDEFMVESMIIRRKYISSIFRRTRDGTTSLSRLKQLYISRGYLRNLIIEDKDTEEVIKIALHRLVHREVTVLGVFKPLVLI